MDDDFFDLEENSTTQTASTSPHSSTGFLIDNDDTDLVDLLQLEGEDGAKPADDPLLPLASMPHLDPIAVQGIPKSSWSELTDWTDSFPTDLVSDRHSVIPTSCQPYLTLTEHQPRSVSMFRKERRSLLLGEASSQHLLHFRGVRPPAKCSDVGFQNPIPREGRLELTEEENRTLMAEGQMLPEKLPLTQEEEQILKRVRRKIKNKISAQDSRRRRKEYIEALESDLQVSNRLNSELHLRLKRMEEANLRLTLQLQRNQSRLVSRPVPVYSTQSGDLIRSTSVGSTCLKLLVLCCAVFLVHDRNRNGQIDLPTSTIMAESRPGLPWVSTVMIVPSWRWSPARHFDLGGAQDPPYKEPDQENSSVISGPKLIMSFVGDGRSRLIIDNEDEIYVEEFGPRYLLFNPSSAESDNEVSDVELSDFQPQVPLQRCVKKDQSEVDQNRSSLRTYHFIMGQCD